MGGNLLKHITRRQNAEEFFIKTSEISCKLVYEVARVNLIPFYTTKESFGDADILYATADDLPISLELIKKLFSPKEIHKNGSVISFDYKEMQVDLIHSTKDAFNYAKAYFGHNDLGNFCGKLSRHFGLKHGHAGLTLPIRTENSDHLIGEVLVTLDHDKFLEFVGLDVSRFKAGFETMEDVYRYVQSSPYFNVDSYKLENISSIGRMRDKKRESYRNFLKFNESYTGPSIERVKDKSVFLERIFSAFPEVREKYNRMIEHHAFLKVTKEKFNGTIVSELTGLKDQELGKFMSHLKSKTIFDSHVVVQLSKETIESNVKNEFTTYSRFS